MIIRRVCSSCGASVDLDTDKKGVQHLEFLHEDDCEWLKEFEKLACESHTEVVH